MSNGAKNTASTVRSTPTPHPALAKLGAVCWLCCFQFFLAEQWTRLHVRGSYSMVRNVISDLGAGHPFGSPILHGTGSSPLHALMNASFLLQAALIGGGALLVRGLLPRGLLANMACLLFLASAAGLALVGAFPEDGRGNLHILGAGLHFLCGSLAMLFLGSAWLRRAGPSRLAGTLTLAPGAFALAATLALASGHLRLWPVGMVERMAAYPLPLWLTCCGLRFLMRTQRTNSH